MSKRELEVVMPLWADRYFPAATCLEGAKAYQQSGVVDRVIGWDQLSSWWPSSLWAEETTPWHSVRPDPDSYADALAMLAASSAVTPGMGLAYTTDSIRRGPAELTQTMLTLSALQGGPAQLHLGAGEIKQLKPFGYKRSQGLRRIEDLYKLFGRFKSETEPFDHEGHFWNLDKAFIGNARPHGFEVWGLGGGPKIIDLSTSYADGFSTMAPWACCNAEGMGSMITKMKEQLERKGRDPEAFGFGIFAAMAMHEDEEVIRIGLDNPILKFMIAVFGRFNMNDWDAEGIEPPMPRDWHYANNLFPASMSRAEADEIVSRVTPEMIDVGWFRGTPRDVASQLEPYIDAGVNWITFVDCLPPVLEPSEAPKALERSLELAALLKKMGSG